MAEASSSSSSTRTTVTNAKFEVEKFDGTNNFGMWQCELLDVLCQQELDVALEEKPDVMDDKEWIKINRQACGTIRLCLAKDQKYSVMREASAKKLWETLEEKYMKKSLENRLYMKKKLYRFTYTHGMSMNDHVNSFNKILADLLNLNERFKDEDKALLLLNFLPDEYDHLTTTLFHGKDNVTFDVVCSALYNSETRKKDRKDHRDTVAEALITRDTPQQNGVAERMNRTILEKVRCILSNAGLGKEFWAEAVVYACHLINHLPSTAIEGRTPMEMWTGKPATDYNSLHVFSSTAFYHAKESKLDPRAKKVLFMGITGGVKGYRLWCPITKKIIFSRDVTFDESTMLKQKDSQEDDKTSSTLQQVEFEKVKVDPAGVDEMDSDSPSIENDKEVLTQEPSQQQDSIAYRRPRREIRKPARFVDMVAYALPIVDNDVHSTYREAISNPESIQWKKAINEEMQSLYKNETWELVTLPKEKKAIGCKWGYAQKEGMDYNEVFSLVVKHSSIRILLAMVAQFDLELVQLNIKTAFLHGDLEEKIYMTQAYGFKVLQQFGMTEQTKPVSTPLASHFKLSPQLSLSTDAELEYMLQVPYSNAVGHWQTVKWILRCIQKTVDVGLLFERDDTLGQGVIGYVNSYYTGDLDKRRSTTGYVFTFAGGPISWKSTLQSTVAMSTTEAEYMAITEVVKEAIWLQGLLENLGLAQEHINVYRDSQSAIHITKNQVYHARTKHIDV
ncbi:hypothetical protein KPL70_003051 [Citrus sinensis]|nr:hypothetical protein KPL70_003051 [Citrus sinensis]